jgi:dihydrofolate reductase
MRIVTYGAACSLDGFIAASDGSVDWLHFSRDVQDVMAAYWATIDTILMGRKTWEVALAQQGSGGGDPGDSAMQTYVFSRTLRGIERPGVHLVSENAGDFVRALKSRKGKGICLMGGGDLAQSLLAAGVIDEVGLNIHPILLGAGVPFFRDAGRIHLELVENRTLDGGCVLASYRVQHKRGARRSSGAARSRRKS